VLTVAVLVTLVALLSVVGWVGLRAWSAKSELEQAQALLTALADRVAAGDYEGIAETYAEAQVHVSAARLHADDRLWRAAEPVPRIGPNLRAVRELVVVVDDVMALGEPLVALADEWETVVMPQDGRIRLELFREVAEDLPALAAGYAALDERVAGIDTVGTLDRVSAAQAQVADLLSAVSTALGEAAPVVSRLPAILGGDAPRTYVVMFQNNAELRSLGGAALFFAEVVVDDGAISLSSVVPATGLEYFAAHDPAIGPPQPDFESVYSRSLGRFIANATLRPSSVGAAQIVAAEWATTFGRDIDGVISMDGGALEALLGTLDPITLSTGDVVGPENVVSLLLNEVYVRYNSGDYPADNLSQNAVYAETLTETFDRVSSGQFDPVTLVRSMTEAATARHFSVWFADAGERDAVATNPAGARDLPESTATEDVIGVYLNDQVGSKLNFYLTSTLTTGSAVCTPPGRQIHRVTLSLTNTLPPEAVPDLSPSISGALYTGLGLNKGDQRLALFLYLPPGARALSASVGGEPVTLGPRLDSGHPVEVLWVTVPPGGTVEVSTDVLMAEPGERTLVVEITPTTAGTTLVTEPLDCGAIPLP
jgi:hypothetical protein